MMNKDIVNFVRLIDQLPNANNKDAVLQDIFTFLTVKNRDEIADLAKNVSFNLIFECIGETTNSEETSISCDVLDKLLEASDVTTLLSQYHDELLHGLAHPVPRVRHLSIKQVKAVCGAGSQLMAPYTDLVCALLQVMGEDLEYATPAAACLTLFGSSEEGLDVLLSDVCFGEVQALLRASDTIRYRVYQLAVDTCVQCEACLNRWMVSGVLAQFLADLDLEDILVQMNCLELLTQLASSRHGLEYLERQGVVVKLENMMKRAEEDPMTAFLMPGLMKFFGHLGAQHPKEVTGRLAEFMNSVVTSCQSRDATLQVIAMETVAHIGRTPEGKRALNKLGTHKMGAVCRALGVTMKGAATEYRSRAIDAATRLLTLQVHEQTEELLAATQGWFQDLDNDALGIVDTLLKQPTLSLRCSAFRLLEVISAAHWGQELLNNRSGFTEYLLDRSTEQQKESKERKYAVLATLASSPTAMEVFGRVYFVKLKEYVNEGPFYVKTETQVAFEGE